MRDDTLSLSARELEVLGWIKEGKTNWETSRILGISERTVQFHIANVIRKLDVSTRAQAVAVGIQHGFLHME